MKILEIKKYRRKEIMIDLPEEYKDRIILRYGELGIEWLSSINDIIEKYTIILKLRNIEIVKDLTINVVLFAYSETYGDVIIKIGITSTNISNEINFIQNCRSEYMVKCLYYNLEDKIMVLERIKPGTPLSILKNREERIKIFCDIVNNILIEDDNKKGEYKEYYDSLKEKIDNKEIYESLDLDVKIMIENMEKLFKDISKMNLKKYILHHDLHYKNILKSDNGWKVIDPHGRVGYKVFEIPQFIKAELEIENNDVNKVHEIVWQISLYLNEDIDLIYKAFYIETVGKIIFYKSAGYNQEVIEYNKNLCNKIAGYINI